MQPDPSGAVPDLEAMLRRPAWFGGAACRGAGHVAYFPSRGESINPAKSVCDSCPVIDDCLAHALADPELQGIWGGTSVKQRQAMRRPSAA